MIQSSSFDFTTRVGTHDHHVIDEVFKNNCYQLPGDLSNIGIIDVGAHIGTFAISCLNRNAAMVWCYEADFNNCQVARENVSKSPRTGRCFVWNLAVVNDLHPSSAYVDCDPIEWHGFRMTGAQNIFAPTNNNTRPVATTPISIVVKRALLSGLPIWLKLDCEGSEHQIIANDLPWSKIDRIFGEVHNVVPLFHERNHLMSCGLSIDCTEKGLVNRLQSVGYNVKLVPYDTDPNLFLFFAERQK